MRWAVIHSFTAAWRLAHFNDTGGEKISVFKMELSLSPSKECLTKCKLIWIKPGIVFGVFSTWAKVLIVATGLFLVIQLIKRGQDQTPQWHGSIKQPASPQLMGSIWQVAGYN